MRVTARARFAGALLLVAVGLAAPVPAQTPPDAAGDPASAQAPAGGSADERLEALWVRGERALAADDLAGARQAFAEALALDERRARSWNYLGGVFFAQGDLGRALEHFRTAHALDPRDVRAMNNLATAHERLGDLERAEELYQSAALLDPGYPEPLRNLGVLYARRLGRPEAARRAWERYLELVPVGPAAEQVRRELEALPPPSPAPPGSP